MKKDFLFSRKSFFNAYNINTTTNSQYLLVL